MQFKNLVGLISLFFITTAFSQNLRWQQRVEYQMEIDMDVDNHQLAGKQTLKYFNNSPDTLNKVYFHLYFNAFQPGSMMDVRSRSIKDPDARVRDRIYNLQPNEMGYHKIVKLTQNDKRIKYSIDGTVMEVVLKTPIAPNTNTTFKMSFESQVPLQIRRSGRNNKEGISYSMSQWFPKIAEYDRRGWHAHQYIAREFYSPWGDFDVKITIDSAYTIAAGGVLQNPKEIGKGYADAKPASAKLTYHFKADNVHDFMWAADPDYVHDVIKVKDDLELHYFYQGDTLLDNWLELQSYMLKAIPFMEGKFGKYPYPVYNFIQGGDGGMEYPMGTLITGHRRLESLVGVSIHEMMHSWYQMMLATNESYDHWMDEGFTVYATNRTKDFLYNQDRSAHNPHESTFRVYVRHALSGEEEPLATHADRFSSNRAYSIGAYYKGALVLRQLEGIIGVNNLEKGLIAYYNKWRFRHPDKIDFLRVMEKQSGLELDWFFDYWVNTTKTIDYAISHVVAAEKTKIQLQRIGEMPMPLDIKVTALGGAVTWYHIPVRMMMGSKPVPKGHYTLTSWPWVNPYYSFEIDMPLDNIERIEIDPGEYLADTNRENNFYPLKSSTLEVHGSIK